MRAIQELTSDYKEIYSVNLQDDKKAALIVNGMALLIGVVMVVSMSFVVPITTLFNMDKGVLIYIIRFLVLIISLAVYIAAHELVHGITMKMLGTKKVEYGYKGAYFYTKSDDYYDKSAYITIALAPVIVFAIIFGVLNLMVPKDWFWVVYLLQVLNISGAAGDLFVTVKFSKMPKDIWIRDNGVDMKIYSV